MSRLKDFVSKGVRLIVSDDETSVPDLEESEPVPSHSAPSRPAPPPRPAAGAPPVRERDIPAQAFAAPPPKKVVRSEVAANVTDFALVYKEAGIALPPHGYGIDKVGEMLESKRLATLAPELKATAVMAALEAAGVAVRDVIQDAVVRDKALDAFEAAKQRELQELRDANQKRISSLTAEMETLVQKINAEIENLKKGAAGSEQAFLEMQTRKRTEEQRLHGIVAHFVEGGENPVTRA